MVRGFVSLLLILMTAGGPALAQGNPSGLLLRKELETSGRGSEYVAGDYPGAVLMSVNLWGSVQRPGIYHVPVKTDLLTLLSYAGGPSSKAILDDVRIKRRTGPKQKLLEVDVDDLLSSTELPSPTLEANDIIHIPETEPAVGDNTMRTIAFISGILGIVTAGLVLSNQLGN